MRVPWGQWAPCAGVMSRPPLSPRCPWLTRQPVVHSDPEILGGTPVFVGTRVPLQNLIDYLAGGDSLNEFLRQFPSVRREQAQAALPLPVRRSKPAWVPPDLLAGPTPAPDPTPGPRRVLFDELVPHDVAAAVTGTVGATVQALGRSGTKDGTLLRAARVAGFEVLVTVDRRMRFQQNIPASGLALVVLRAWSTRVRDLLPLVAALQAVLPHARTGTVTELRAPQVALRLSSTEMRRRPRAHMIHDQRRASKTRSLT